MCILKLKIQGSEMSQQDIMGGSNVKGVLWVVLVSAGYYG